MNVDSKIKEMYSYALEIAFMFESNRYLRKDLVHDVMLPLLENPDKLVGIKFIKSWVWRSLKWKANDYNKSSYNTKVSKFSALDKEIPFVENHESVSYIDPIVNLDRDTVISYLLSKKFNPTNFKGNTVGIFEALLEGENVEDISKKLNITKRTITQTTYNVRKKIKQEFPDLKYLRSN